MTRTRNFSPWASWMLKLAATEPIDPLPLDLRELDPWRARVRARLVEALGPAPEPVPLDLETTSSEIVRGGEYRRERVVFDSESTMSVPAELLVPLDRSEPGPAVLAIHGHGPGKSQVCGLTHDADEPPNGDYAHQLARRGYVVLAPDLRCFGERLDWNPPDHYACDTNLVHAVMAGEVPLAANLWDLSRALDVLEQHPLVDPRRMGAVGLSYGGTCTLFLAALDDRVAASVVSGYLSSWAEAHKMPWNMCGSQVLPGMLGRFEHVDIAALIAPRPLLVESGRDDDIFPLEAAEATVAELRRVYDHLDSPDTSGCLEHDVFDGGHQWHGERAYLFLERWLGRLTGGS
jgi:dienelactone hydrolase